jgi:DNA-binding transcriptional LysR family regulator
VDLNLLTAFQILLEERNITRAAKRLYISQPAMSRIVDRLQVMFNDEILVRTAQGYEPTHRALEIQTELDSLLPKLDQLFHQAPFDPSSATGTVRVETVDWGATVLLPKLIGILQKEAPEVSIEIYPRRGVFDRLESNEIDLLIAGNIPQNELDEKSLRSSPMVQEELVCVMRAGHPLARGPLTLERYLSAKHVSLQFMQGRRLPTQSATVLHNAMDHHLTKLGYIRDIRVRTPYFIPIGEIVENSDLLATMPSHLSRWVQSPKVRIVPVPKEIPGYTVTQVWHPRNDAIPLQRWIRETLGKVAEQLTSGGPYNAGKQPRRASGSARGAAELHRFAAPNARTSRLRR